MNHKAKRVLAALLGYPHAELRQHLPEMADILRRDRAIPASRLIELEALRAQMENFLPTRPQRRFMWALLSPARPAACR